MTGLCNEATACVSPSPTLVAMPSQTAFHNDVPSRVGHLPFRLRPLKRNRVGVSEITASAPPQNAEQHSERETRRDLARPSESLCHHVLRVHQRSPLGKFVGVPMSQPYCSWKTFSQSLRVTAMAGDPYDVDGISADIMN